MSRVRPPSGAEKERYSSGCCRFPGALARGRFCAREQARIIGAVPAVNIVRPKTNNLLLLHRAEDINQSLRHRNHPAPRLASVAYYEPIAHDPNHQIGHPGCPCSNHRHRAATTFPRREERRTPQPGGNAIQTRTQREAPPEDLPQGRPLLARNHPATAQSDPTPSGLGLRQRGHAGAKSAYVTGLGGGHGSPHFRARRPRRLNRQSGRHVGFAPNSEGIPAVSRQGAGTPRPNWKQRSVPPKTFRRAFAGSALRLCALG